MSDKKVTMPDEEQVEEAVPMSEEERHVVEEDENPPVEEEELVGPVKLEDLDPEELLWQPDGPKIGQVMEWQDEFGEGEVYVTTLTYDKHLVWRTMTRPEYRQLIRDMETAAQEKGMSAAEVQLYQEEYITDMCALYYNGNDAINDLAGTATIISSQVMDHSGFVPLETRQF